MCRDPPEWQGGVVVLAEMSGLPGGKKKVFFRAKAETFDPTDEFCCKKGDSEGEVFQSDLFQVEKGKLLSVFNF